MKERLESLIKRLDEMREEVLIRYLSALENKYLPDEGNIVAVKCAGILYDLDRHITNLHLELKRMELESRRTVTHG